MQYSLIEKNFPIPSLLRNKAKEVVKNLSFFSVFIASGWAPGGRFERVSFQRSNPRKSPEYFHFISARCGGLAPAVKKKHFQNGSRSLHEAIKP